MFTLFRMLRRWMGSRLGSTRQRNLITMVGQGRVAIAFQARIDLPSWNEELTRLEAVRIHLKNCQAQVSKGTATQNTKHLGTADTNRPIQLDETRKVTSSTCLSRLDSDHGDPPVAVCSCSAFFVTLQREMLEAQIAEQTHLRATACTSFWDDFTLAAPAFAAT